MGFSVCGNWCGNFALFLFFFLGSGVMGVALCHRVPRHPIFYASFFLLVCAFVLHALCFRFRDEIGGSGWVKDKGNGFVFGALSAFGPRLEGRCCLSNEAASCDAWKEICSFTQELSSKGCVHFLVSSSFTNFLFVTGFSFLIAALIFCLLFSRLGSSSSSEVRWRVVIALTVPLVFFCATVVLYYVKVVPSAISASERCLNTSSQSLYYHRGKIPNLYIAVVTLSCAAWLALFCYSFFLSFRTVFCGWCGISVNSASSREPKGPKDDFLIDDAACQKEVLREHAKAVRTEVFFKTEADPFFGSAERNRDER